MSRKTAREIAMKQLYAQCVHGDGEYDELLSLSGIEKKSTEADRKYAAELVDGVTAKLGDIDGAIGAHTVGWTLERLALVDLCIMRIAVYEMLYDAEVPVGAAINEAVELSKRFCDDKTPAFVNGVLGSIARETQKGSVVERSES